ncbi:MAG: ATP-dependent helicase [Euzebyaceae bacterium]|nr:ATP-dependent helicase [Euzebyaceae bacterium]
MFDEPWLDGLNAPQREAVAHGDGPLLVLAGAGSGKTATLACRVARLIADGVPPERILLLTFTRRAAVEMLQRAAALTTPQVQRRVWGGTFHAVGHRLLRAHGRALGLAPEFSVVDQGDAADLLDLVRDDLGLAGGDRRFPRKDTLAAVYSRTVNAGAPLAEVIGRHFPWCRPHVDAVAGLFRAYTARKRAQHLLDYDDLLLWWDALLGVPGVGDDVANRFDHVLVDEYQDTNALQAGIVRRMGRASANVTVVGDDAQAIYGFRAASVDHILRFPADFPGATVVRLEQNYRSTQPILDAANAVMAQSGLRFDKSLWSQRAGAARPRLHTCADEADQSERVCTAVLARREQGVVLRDQAVLFRTGHHSAHLEIELARRNVPFVKFGGLRFLEAAHVKDLLAFLRLLDNPADEVAWFRVLQLLDGMGPASARRVLRDLVAAGPDAALRRLVEQPPPVPAAAAADYAALGCAVADCLDGALGVGAQIERFGRFYAPLCARRHRNAAARLRDLSQLEVIAGGAPSRAGFVADLVLDPPNSTGDLAGPPLLDEDYLVLSTIHSAKGLEWDSVHVIHAADGMIPSDMATGSSDEIEEERRLLYVALTRAKDRLDVHVPLRYYHQRFGGRDAHSYGQVSRFLAGQPATAFDAVGPAVTPREAAESSAAPPAAAVDRFLERLWG